jgi:hypothetical protein
MSWKPKKIYVASSWKNTYHAATVEFLRGYGHTVYDYRDYTGFNWAQIDPKFEDWRVEEWVSVIRRNPISRSAFVADRSVIEDCETLVMIAPAGLSTHLEAGYAAGLGKRLVVYITDESTKPELLYGLFDAIVFSGYELAEAI